MKKVYLIHYLDGTKENGWYLGLVHHLKGSNVHVEVLDMPNSNVQKMDTWVNTLDKCIENLNEEVYFIGHSIGCQIILRYLETKEIQNIGGILLVNPIYIAKPGLEMPIDFAKIKKFTRNITCIFLNDDYFVPLNQKNVFQEKSNILMAVGKMLGLEFVEILDEKGQITGKIVDKEIAHDQKLLHNGVVILIGNDKGQVLLQKRSSQKRFEPNKWEMCGGHVHAYETLETAARREVFEELGLEIKENELIPLEYMQEKDSSHIFNFYYINCNKTEGDFSIQQEELTEVKWFDVDEIVNMVRSNDKSIVFSKNRVNLLKTVTIKTMFK